MPASVPVQSRIPGSVVSTLGRAFNVLAGQGNNRPPRLRRPLHGVEPLALQKHRSTETPIARTAKRGEGGRRRTRFEGKKALHPFAEASRRTVAASGAVGLKRRQIYAFFTFSQSASNFARPSAVSGCLTQFFKAPKGTVAMSAPMSAAAVTWYGLRMEAAMISHSWPKS